MLSGLRYNLLQIAFFLILITNSLSGCKERVSHTSLSFAAPFQGQNFSVGQNIKVKLEIGKELNPDSIAYTLDGVQIAKGLKLDSLTINTTKLKLGFRLISAIVSNGGKKDTITTNIVLKNNIEPIKLSYTVVNTFPHAIDAYTQGLSIVDGKFLESTGEKGRSKLREVALSGKVSREVSLDSQYFGEGSVKVGNKILMLTWQDNIGLIFDANTFKQRGTFPYQNSREGWGLTFDGSRLLKSDGSNKIWFLNAKTFKEEDYIEVYDHNGAVTSLNELEYIEGNIYANVYLTSKIVVIDPNSGAVKAYIDAESLVPKDFFKTPEEMQNNVLNGIAWDADQKRLFLGGKKWPKIYEIKLNKTPAKK